MHSSAVGQALLLTRKVLGFTYNPRGKAGFSVCLDFNLRIRVPFVEEMSSDLCEEFFDCHFLLLIVFLIIVLRSIYVRRAYISKRTALLSM